MAQVKMKKLNLQRKLQDVAKLLLTVDQAIMSVRLRLFELENWKSNLVNKVHLCQIELMGLDSFPNCSHDEDDKLSCITSTTSLSESIEVDDDDGEDEDNHTTSDGTSEQNNSTRVELQQNDLNEVETIEEKVVNNNDRDGEPNLRQQVIEVQEEKIRKLVLEDEKKEKEEEEEENKKIVKTEVHSEKIEDDNKVNHIKENEQLSSPPPVPTVEVPFKRNLRTPAIILIEQGNVKNFSASNNLNKNNSKNGGLKTSSNADKINHHHLEFLNNNNNLSISSNSSSTTSLKVFNGVEDHHKIMKKPKSSSSSSSKVSVKSNHSKVSVKSNHSKVSVQSNHSKGSVKSNHSKVSVQSNHSKGSVKSNCSERKIRIDKVKTKNLFPNLDLKTATTAFVSLKRLRLSSDSDRFIFESRSNTWIPVKRTRRVAKPRQQSQDIYSASSSQASNVVEEPTTHRRERSRTNERTKSVTRRAPIKEINKREKRIGQFRALDKQNISKIKPVTKQGVKSTKTITRRGNPRGKGKPKLRNEIDTTIANRSKVVKMKRENVKSKKAKYDRVSNSSLPQKEIKSKKKDRRDKHKESKKQRVVLYHAHPSSQLTSMPINEEDYDDDVEFLSESLPTLVASAMTINHMGQSDVPMPTHDQYNPNYTGQELWDDLGNDLGQNRNIYQLDEESDSFICDQCGHKADSLADLRVHQMVTACSLSVQDVPVSEFTQEMEQQSSNLVNMDIPFDDPYRYGHLQSGDDIPVAFEEEVTHEETVMNYEEVSEKVLVQPRDSNFLIWDGMIPESFNEVDVQTDPLQPTVLNGLLQVPTPRTTTEYYHSLPVLSPAEPFSHNNNHY